MRPYLYVVAILLLGSAAWMNTGNAQTIPNAGFENWPGGIVSGWKTSNSPPTFTNVTQSTDPHTGSFALRGAVVDAGIGIGISPSIITDPGFPVNSAPGALHGWYKSSLSSGDVYYITVAFMKAGTAIGTASSLIGSSSSVYKEFVANPFYPSGGTPDSVVITMSIYGSLGYATIGSFFIVDDLSWGAPTDVKEVAAGAPAKFALEQNFPNPFNPSTQIVFDIAEKSDVSLKVFDTLGREVSTLVNDQLSPGRYRVAVDATGLASGVYFYRLQSGGSIATKTFTVLK